MAGPYLSTAVICERVEIGDDGAVTLSRIFDQLSFSSSELRAYDLSLYFSFHADQAQPPSIIDIMVETPSGETRQIVRGPLVFVPGQQARTIHSAAYEMVLYTGFWELGQYWFHALVNEVFVTKLPLTVVVEDRQA
jgi:hypothetical protein